MQLPAEVKAAIEQELAGYPVSQLAAISAALSDSYRTGLSSRRRRHLRSQEDAAAYAAFRLPATFAAVYSVLAEVKGCLSDWRPETCLDVGAGPGTAAWAVTMVWQDLSRVTLLEREQSMIELGRRLFAQSTSSALHRAEWMQVDVTDTWLCGLQDLVIASYVLNELPEKKTREFAERLWQSTKGVLVIVEPGTPAGFIRIREVREHLLSFGAATIAPCPHDEPCPLAEDDWCHFSERVSRSRLHRQVKAGELSYEDEKYSYVCLSRQRGEGIAGRVLRHPQTRKGYIELDLCTPEGISHKVVTRKDKEGFRRAKDLKWGSAIR